MLSKVTTVHLELMLPPSCSVLLDLSAPQAVACLHPVHRALSQVNPDSPMKLSVAIALEDSTARSLVKTLRYHRDVEQEHSDTGLSASFN